MCASTRRLALTQGQRLVCTCVRPPEPFHLGQALGVALFPWSREKPGKTERLDQRRPRLCRCLRTCGLLRAPEGEAGLGSGQPCPHRPQEFTAQQGGETDLPGLDFLIYLP